MTNLTNDQIRQLNSYSIYMGSPKYPLFSLHDLLDKTEDCLMTVQAISASPNKTVAASFFLRRLGMFISIQLLHLSTYDEIWDGDDERLRFGAVEEYGNRTVSMFVEMDDWRSVEERD